MSTAIMKGNDMIWYAAWCKADGFYADRAIRADYMSHVIDYYIQLEEADVAGADR